MPITDFDAERAYDADQFAAHKVFRTDNLQVVCGYFEPGQFIPVHGPDSDLVVAVQSGTGVVREDKPNPAFNSHDWTLESVRRILEFAEPERETIRGLKDFGVMSVSDACNLTPTCSTLCPTDAIRRTDDGNLQFNHEDCVNCGLCEEGCPETAITMHDGLDLSRLPENRDGERWETVYEGEMRNCVRCGKAFASEGTAEHIAGEVGELVEGVAPKAEHSIFDYCGNCRAYLLFEEGGR